ncbi:unnamed protein product [Meganyctiphanes norvegica]|uniref:RGS domain-containing protein n=1 Tax=Meganyctiphanes norvegica TaxID=48144 RepID=A0AAV2R362_MEGNR
MPTKAQCHKWKLSIRNVLEDPDGLKRFQTFLIKHEEECGETEGEFTRYTYFWTECKNFKKLKSPNQRESASKIYNTYLNSKAEKKIGIIGSDDIVPKVKEKVFSDKNNSSENQKVNPSDNISSVFDVVEAGMLEHLSKGGCCLAYKEFCNELKPDKRTRFQCRLM